MKYFLILLMIISIGGCGSNLDLLCQGSETITTNKNESPIFRERTFTAYTADYPKTPLTMTIDNKDFRKIVKNKFLYSGLEDGSEFVLQRGSGHLKLVSTTEFKGVTIRREFEGLCKKTTSID